MVQNKAKQAQYLLSAPTPIQGNIRNMGGIPITCSEKNGNGVKLLYGLRSYRKEFLGLARVHQRKNQRLRRLLKTYNMEENQDPLIEADINRREPVKQEQEERKES